MLVRGHVFEFLPVPCAVRHAQVVLRCVWHQNEGSLCIIQMNLSPLVSYIPLLSHSSLSLSLSLSHLYPHVTLPIFKSNSHFFSVSLCVSVWVFFCVCVSFFEDFQHLNLREITINLLHHSWALIRLRARLLSDGSLNRGPAHPPQFWEIIWSLDSLIMHGRRP